MPKSKFGGVPVEEAAPATGSKFGGVPVDESPVATEQKKSEERGFWGSLIGTPGDFVEGAKGLWNTVRHPLDTINAMGQQTIDLGKSAVDSFRKGDVIGGTRRAINTGINAVVPGLGAGSEAAGQDFDRGNIRGGFGRTAALGTQAVAGAKLPAAVKSAATAELPKSPFRVDPRVATTRALGPLSKDPDFAAQIPDTLARVKKANNGVNPATVTGGKVDLIPAVERTIGEHQQAIDPFMRRAKGVTVSGDALVEAAERAIPNLDRVRDPVGTAAVIQRVRDAFGGRMFPVEAFKDWLKTENADLNAFYRRSPDAQQTGAIAGSTPAIEAAMANATRDTLYRAIDPEGQGANIRTIQGATKNLYDFKNAVSNRAGGMVAQEPLNLMESIVRPFKKLLPFGGGSKAAALGSVASDGRSIPLLRRAFDAVDQDVNALPRPASEFYPVGDTTRLLTSGDIITPPPADTSFVRGVPGMYPTGPNPARALPPASTRFAGPPGAEGAHPTTSASPLRAGRGPTLTPDSPSSPPDTSFVRSVPGQRAVPQADPSVIPPSHAGRIIDMTTRPAPHGRPAGEGWWSSQPLTKTELQQRYAELFNRAENLSPQRPVRVPSSGIPESVARATDARQNVARQVLQGRTWEQATAAERNAIDSLISEGYGSAPPNPIMGRPGRRGLQ